MKKTASLLGLILILNMITASITGCGTSVGKGTNTSSNNTISNEHRVRDRDDCLFRIGYHVYFGEYEQDGNEENGKERIDWIVLEIKDNQALLLSYYALDAKAFDEKGKTNKWENSTLRKWLNQDFFKSAFSEQEKKAIVETEGSILNKGKIFILSETQVTQSFSTAGERTCTPTQYATINDGTHYSVKYFGGYTGGTINIVKKNKKCDWWIKKEDSSFGIVSFEGDLVNRPGDRVYAPDIGIRPALWIDMQEYDYDSELEAMTTQDKDLLSTHNLLVQLNTNKDLVHSGKGNKIVVFSEKDGKYIAPADFPYFPLASYATSVEEIGYVISCNFWENRVRYTGIGAGGSSIRYFEIENLTLSVTEADSGKLVTKKQIKAGEAPEYLPSYAEPLRLNEKQISSACQDLIEEIGVK